MKVLGKKIDPHITPTFMKKEVEAENAGLSVRPKLDEYEPYIESKEFRKQNMNFILENDLSGYEFIGRDCMVTI